MREGNEHWTLLLLLLQIINIVFSLILTRCMTVHLKHLTIDHNSLFSKLYPERNLIPINHFMVHFAGALKTLDHLYIIGACGVSLNTCFFFKKNTIKNFKSITKSLAKEHQMSIAAH